MHVQGGDTLDLGNGHVLEFVMAPNLHWPDTMLTLDRKSGILFTCDVFGMHYCSQAVSDSNFEVAVRTVVFFPRLRIVGIFQCYGLETLFCSNLW